MPHVGHPDDLSAREREVLDLVRLGLTNEEIAGRLGITEAGVKYHVSQILSKLGVSTREEAAAVALAPHRRWWAALPLAAKAAGVTVVLAAVAGLGVLAWGVVRTSGEAQDGGQTISDGREVFRVEGASMQPALANGMEVPVEPYNGQSPARGDIVVFTAPTAPDRSFVKRVIGLPGDHIEITFEGKVVLNGKILDEPYVQGITNCFSGDCKNIRVPGEGSPESRTQCGSDHCYFVMGDNRQNSNDSRQGWLVPLQNIHGWVEPRAASTVP